MEKVEGESTAKAKRDEHDKHDWQLTWRLELLFGSARQVAIRGGFHEVQKTAHLEILGAPARGQRKRVTQICPVAVVVRDRY